MICMYCHREIEADIVQRILPNPIVKYDAQKDVFIINILHPTKLKSICVNIDRRAVSYSYASNTFELITDPIILDSIIHLFELYINELKKLRK